MAPSGSPLTSTNKTNYSGCQYWYSAPHDYEKELYSSQQLANLVTTFAMSNQGGGNLPAGGANACGQGARNAQQGAGNIVQQGAGNVVQQGAGNIVQQGAGANISAQGGQGGPILLYVQGDT